MTDQELQEALAGAKGEGAQADAVLGTVQDLLQRSRDGVVPGFNLAVSGIYPSFSATHHDAEPPVRTRIRPRPQGFRVNPAWDKRLFTVTPAAFIDYQDAPLGEPRVIVPKINGSPITSKGVLPMFSQGGGIFFEHTVEFTGTSGGAVTRKLLQSRIVSKRLTETPAWARLEVKVFANSDRRELVMNPTTLVAYQPLAWYGADGVLVGGAGFGIVGNLTNPSHPLFGKYDLWSPNILTVLV